MGRQKEVDSQCLSKLERLDLGAREWKCSKGQQALSSWKIVFGMFLLYSVVNLVVIVIVLCTIQMSGGDGLHFMASEASIRLCFCASPQIEPFSSRTKEKGKSG